MACRNGSANKNYHVMNTIINHITGTNLTDEQINDVLLCDGHEIRLWDVSKCKTGYGHWHVTTSIEVNGEKLDCTILTTDSVSIDQWGEDENDSRDSFVIQCLRQFEDEIANLANGNQD